MLDISVLYGGLETASTPHRYGRPITQIDPPEHQRMRLAKSAESRRPIVVWNLTRTCNLHCVHCYTDSAACAYPDELNTKQCKRVLDDLAAYQVPAVLFSGGEPLVRPDLFELADYARALGLHVVLSTNGTLIDGATAERIKSTKFAYVGISLDAADPDVHDEFRGQAGAFKRTIRGIRACKSVGQKVGLRLTLTRQTWRDLDRIFELIEAEGIDRACFYHLCPQGRGTSLASMTHAQTRQALEKIFNHARRLAETHQRVEILTVDHAADGPLLYLKMLRENHPRTQQVLDMLLWNGGARYSSGVGIANIDFHGNVHADQFSMHRSFGNVLERPFSEIWSDTSDPVMAGLKNRLSHLRGRCGSCRFKSICAGSLRARAETLTGDLWAADPACYLSFAEISGTPVELTVERETANATN